MCVHVDMIYLYDTEDSYIQNQNVYTEVRKIPGCGKILALEAQRPEFGHQNLISAPGSWRHSGGCSGFSDLLGKFEARNIFCL